MIEGLLFLLIFQVAGEALVRGLGWPLPGPVAGMALLLLFLLWRRSCAPALKQAGDGLLGNLSLLFVPAGVGLITQGPLLAKEGLTIVLVLVLSTLATLLATAMTLTALLRWQARRKARHGG